MTQEDKQLLLKDLCGRLPYGVVCKISYTFNNETTNWEDVESTCDDIITKINFDTKRVFSDWLSEYSSIDDVKPYLRPMSSMTEEEKTEYHKQVDIDLGRTAEVLKEQIETGTFNTENRYTPQYCHIDWLNANHFDYRGLIEMGLALEMPEDMYKNF